jgi:LPXTG-motif cell wall-anchored protein
MLDNTNLATILGIAAALVLVLYVSRRSRRRRTR